MSATKEVAYQLKRSEKFFGYAGTKDRRAFTSQFMTCKFLTMEAVKGAARGLQSKGIYLGNMEYVSEDIRLGFLRGNKFTITMRNVEGDDDTIRKAVEEISKTGFINYFGLQRFGTSSISTHTIGKALLKGDWKGAFDLILKPRSGDFSDTRAAKDLYYVDNDIEGAAAAMPFSEVAEQTLLRGLLKHGPTNFLNAIFMINRKLRSMYIHAYQSYLFNKAASKRVSEFDRDFAVEGDLVLVPGTDNLKGEKGTAAAPSTDVANATADGGEVETNPPAEDGDDDLDGDYDPLDTGGEYRLVTAEEAASKVFSIYDVVLPIPGYSVMMPTNSIGAYYDELLAEDGIESSIWSSSKHYDFRMPGAYRKLIERGGDVAYNVYNYNDITIPLSMSDSDICLGKDAPVSVEGGRHKAVVVSFTLKSSTYATMFIRELLKCPSYISEMHDEDGGKGVADEATATEEKGEKGEEVVVVEGDVLA